ncbi:EscU/YscU/HrcU family type III secretion system export apparatus switch protein [Aestuariispira ectoiniformans]|uniref:EscU/YscU/HrcU family type III secretion system export apparatus switch protein n=1 Tax=Aestuariispira ectoiniformans TaxID=2775080 RepID=UPI00223B9D5E|nr:EscU/YscU/HrcU family type III secretion system export apparatus switch protein [Aestuariispira ectoiniformans]
MPASPPSKNGDNLESFLGSEKPSEVAPPSESEKDDSVAVALSYDPSDKERAPSILASGKGALAERILAEAEAHGIPVHKDADLVQILAATEIGDEIPVEAFIAVAEILRYVYAANGKKLGGD